MENKIDNLKAIEKKGDKLMFGVWRHIILQSYENRMIPFEFDLFGNWLPE